MDISIPKMDGWEATQRLKADETTRGIPIIALTAHALEEDRQKAIQAGCDGYLAKPVEPRRVVQEVERFVGPARRSGPRAGVRANPACAPAINNYYLRRRAPITGGAMAKDKKAELIKGLNEDLAHEYTAIISYMLFSRLVTGPLRLELAGSWRARSRTSWSTRSSWRTRSWRWGARRRRSRRR
jgi:YesN/AraC family two-component response regulator